MSVLCWASLAVMLFLTFTVNRRDCHETEVGLTQLAVGVAIAVGLTVAVALGGRLLGSLLVARMPDAKLRKSPPREEL